MDDTKLLELAGQAAGEKYDAINNPLERDDLALRLAVKLRLNLNFEEFDGVEYACAVHCKSHQGCDDAIADDANASVRRAIVRAAAETSRAKGGGET